ALAQLPDLVRHTVKMAEARLHKIGLVDRPLSELGAAKKLALVAEAYTGKLVGGVLALALAVILAPLRLLGFFRRKRLTETYLDDPLVRDGRGESAEPRPHLADQDEDDPAPHAAAEA